MMKRRLHRADRKKAPRLSVVMMVVVTLLLTGHSSESLLRDVAEGDELVAVAVAELNAYYAESPGFRYARAITIDTAYLEKALVRRDLKMRGHGSVLPMPRRIAKRGGSGILEWFGKIPGRTDENGISVELTKIDEKFYGSYHENNNHYVIMPYRSGGKWMTMALVYDNEPQRCGVGMRATYEDEEVAQ